MASKTPLWKSHYSYHFNILLLFGAWPLQSRFKILRILYRYFQYIMLIFAAGFTCSLLQDLYMVFGDLKKTSWNICITTVFTGATFKSLLVYLKSDAVNDLRMKLHEDVESRDNPEDVAINNFMVYWTKKTRNYLYAIIVFVGSLWQVSRYMSKYEEEKLMPIPLYVPKEIDLNVGFNFDVVFIVFSILSSWGVLFIIEQEMAMFALLLQIKREYDIFLSNIPKLAEIRACQAGAKKSKANNFVRDLYVRQQTIMTYVQMFENSYNKAMVIQVVFTIVLCVAIGVQFIVLPVDALTELTHQVAYMGIVLMDLYLLCLIGTKLNSQCQDVGKTLYETPWYSMNPSSRKDLLLMILFSQRPPRITSTKTMVIDLVAFMTTMKTIYSWLALFRQFALKTDN